MKINLKFGQKQESVSTGLQVITNLRVGGCGCEKDSPGWKCRDEAGEEQNLSNLTYVQQWRSHHNCPINIPFDDPIN
jgi:hypothetical protein